MAFSATQWKRCTDYHLTTKTHLTPNGVLTLTTVAALGWLECPECPCFGLHLQTCSGLPPRSVLARGLISRAVCRVRASSRLASKAQLAPDVKTSNPVFIVRSGSHHLHVSEPGELLAPRTDDVDRRKKAEVKRKNFTELRANLRRHTANNPVDLQVDELALSEDSVFVHDGYDLNVFF